MVEVSHAGESTDSGDLENLDSICSNSVVWHGRSGFLFNL